MEVEGQVTEVKVDMTISRSDRPEATEAQIDLTEVGNLPIQDQDGNEFLFGDAYKDKKTIVVFLRVSLFTRMLWQQPPPQCITLLLPMLVSPVLRICREGMGVGEWCT